MLRYHSCQQATFFSLICQQEQANSSKLPFLQLQYSFPFVRLIKLLSYQQFNALLSILHFTTAFEQKSTGLRFFLTLKRKIFYTPPFYRCDTNTLMFHLKRKVNLYRRQIIRSVDKKRYETVRMRINLRWHRLSAMLLKFSHI